MQKLKLESFEGDIFQVDITTAKVCGVLNTMLDILGVGDEEEVVPLRIVTSEMMKKVIDWATHHKEEDGAGLVNVEVGSAEGNRPFNLPDWEAQFLNEDPSTLYQLFEVADYLDIPRLEKAAWDAFVDLIMWKAIEELCEMFNRAL